MDNVQKVLHSKRTLVSYLTLLLKTLPTKDLTPVKTLSAASANDSLDYAYAHFRDDCFLSAYSTGMVDKTIHSGVVYFNAAILLGFLGSGTI